jgi:hypothetical protein
MIRSAIGTIDAPQNSTSMNMSRDAIAPLMEACASKSSEK